MTGQDPLAPPGDEPSLEDRLSEAALAAVMGDPYEVGLRIALDDGVAEAMPVVARELAYLDRAVAATQGRLAGLAASPLPGEPAAVQAALPQAGEAPVTRAPALAPVGGDAPSGLAAIAAAGVRLLPADLAARVAPSEIVPAAVPAQAAVAEAAPGLGRLDWGGVDWGRLAAPIAVAASSAPVPAAAEGAAPEPGAGVAQDWPAWSAAPAGGQALPSAAPGATFVMPEGMDGFGARQDIQAPSAPVARDGGEDAPGGDAGEGEREGIGGVLEVDGALLGRFIAEQLGREAGRPPSGMTGFDPLVSPAWMSASVG